MDKQDKQYSQAEVAAILMRLSRVTKRLALNLAAEELPEEEKGEIENEPNERVVIVLG